MRERLASWVLRPISARRWARHVLWVLKYYTLFIFGLVPGSYDIYLIPKKHILLVQGLLQRRVLDALPAGGRPLVPPWVEEDHVTDSCFRGLGAILASV